MADSEFEEFRQYFDQLPQHIRAPAKCYTLVHDITPCEDLPSIENLFPLRKIDSSSGDCQRSENADQKYSSKVYASRADLFPEPQGNALIFLAPPFDPPASDNSLDVNKPQPARRRRKLPEIPKAIQQPQQEKQTPSLAEELSRMEINTIHAPFPTDETNTHNSDKPNNSNFCKVEQESPCDSDVWPGTDGDSGRDSTAHSPEGSKSPSPYIVPTEDIASSTPNGEPLPVVPDVEATHRGLHKFTARHPDEVDIDIGDPVYVEHEADDCWCEGINLRTGRRGIFPSAYVIDIDYDFDQDGRRVNKERYMLSYMGSMETTAHKGEHIICSAVEKARQLILKNPSQSCILEISDHGLHVMDKCAKTADLDRLPHHDYFYALKNVTFCGFHPTEPQYLGFITKHPTEERFACHIFEGNGSTRHVAEAIGRAFQRFCRKFMELAYPIHEFYME